MTFMARTTAPENDNKYYIHIDGGGYNKCIKIKGNQCLPNCVGYAYGRFMEEVGKTSCKLPMCNAEDWWSNTSAYEKGQTPKVGAVMCFRKGNVKDSSDGAGHVLIVEEVNDDGSIICSQSGYNYKRFYTSTFKKPYSMKGYVLQGFIYNPDVKTEVFKVGQTYTVHPDVGLNIRKAATRTAAKVGAFPKGKKVICQAVNGNWIKVTYGKTTGWICGKEGTTFYLK